MSTTDTPFNVTAMTARGDFIFPVTLSAEDMARAAEYEQNPQDIAISRIQQQFRSQPSNPLTGRFKRVEDNLTRENEFALNPSQVICWLAQTA